MIKLQNNSKKFSHDVHYYFTCIPCTRGPVGVQGLLTYRWLLNSQASDGHIVADFSTNSSDGCGEPLLKYTHTILNDYDK